MPPHELGSPGGFVGAGVDEPVGVGVGVATPLTIKLAWAEQLESNLPSVPNWVIKIIFLSSCSLENASVLAFALKVKVNLLPELKVLFIFHTNDVVRLSIFFIVGSPIPPVVDPLT